MKCVPYADGMAHVVTAPYIPARPFYFNKTLGVLHICVSIGRQTLEEVKYTEI